MLRAVGAARVRVAEDRVRAFPDSVKDHLRCCVCCSYSARNRDLIRHHLQDSYVAPLVSHRMSKFNLPYYSSGSCRHDVVASEEELDQYFYVHPDKPWRELPKIFVRFYEADDYKTFDVKLEERWRNIA